MIDDDDPKESSPDAPSFKASLREDENFDQGDKITLKQNVDGLHQLIERSVSYERLPMLEVVFDRFVRILSTSLRNFTSDNVEILFEGIQSIRLGGFLNKIPLPCLLFVFKAEEWDNLGLFLLDHDLVCSFVDVILGGKKGQTNASSPSKSYTTLERNLSSRLATLLLEDLTRAFEPICVTHFNIDRLETNPRYATIAHDQTITLVAQFSVQMEDRGGNMKLAFPYSTIEPVRELLLQSFMGEKFGSDSIWETHLSEELWKTDFSLEAVLPSFTIDLKKVLEWEVGTRILFDTTPQSNITIACGHEPVLQGKIGQRMGRMAIRIEESLLEIPEIDRPPEMSERGLEAV